MTYTHLKTLKDTQKSKIYLVYEEESRRLFVEKHLSGRVEVYAQLMKLEHKYLPKIYDVRFDENETVVIEEYISGGSIGDIRPAEKQLSVWLLELCEVIGFLHQHNIIHRDIKPSNILIGEDGHIRLIDFDAARERKDDSHDSDTRLLGTKGFAPPEQYGFAQTDKRADIYAIGITWKTLLGDKAERPEYKNILKRCTDLDPKRRYDSASQLAFAWKMRKLRRFVPLFVIIIAALAIFAGWQVYDASRSQITQDSYPTEDILFYSTEGEYVYAQASELRESAKVYSIETLIDSNKKKDFLELKADSDGDIEVILRTDGITSQDVFDDMRYKIPFYSYLEHYSYYEDDFRKFRIPDDMYIQATCLDLDGDRSKEVIISVGDGYRQMISAVYHIKNGNAVFDGFMWGSTDVTLTSDGIFEAGLLNNIYAENNKYRYINDSVTEVECVDRHEYWDAVFGDIPLDDFLDTYSPEEWELVFGDDREIYDELIRLLKAEDYNAAVSFIDEHELKCETIRSYAQMMIDAEVRIDEKNEMRVQEYTAAEDALRNGDYTSAIKGFAELGEYMDSKSRLEYARSEARRALLENRMTFIDTETGNKSALVWESEAVPGVPWKYTLIDFENDGIMELVVEFDFNSDRLVLHEYEGEYYGFYRVFREMKSLKENGLFEGSGDAFESSVSTCVFSGDTMQDIVVIEGDSESDYWCVNGKEVDETTYYDAMSVFWDMPEAVWYDIAPIQ